MLADRNLARLASERLHLSIDKNVMFSHSDVLPYHIQWMEFGDSYGRIGRRIAAHKGIRTP